MQGDYRWVDEEWVTDDITFCMSECDYKKCRRHPSNMRNKNIPHSMALLKDTDLCERDDSEWDKD